MAGELGGGYGGPVKAPQQGLPHLGAPAGAVGRVEAHIQHGAGGVVHRSKGTRKTQGIGARQVGGDQGNVPGIKGMDQIVRLLNGSQGNGVPGQGLALPPAGAGFQREVLPRAGEHVGPRTQGDASRLLDDGDVQQGGQSTVGAAQGDGHHAVGGGDVRHAGEAGGVEGLMRARLREAAISAAVRGLPSEKVTPLRGIKDHWRPSADTEAEAQSASWG